MTMQIEVLRLQPGEDLRGALEAAFRGLCRERAMEAACVVSAVGSLSRAELRYADASGGSTLDGPLELLSLTGTLSLDGPHLHAAVADAAGRVSGGHVLRGCTVRTTAELVLGLLPGWQFSRRRDAATGFLELAPRRPQDSR